MMLMIVMTPMLEAMKMLVMPMIVVMTALTFFFFLTVLAAILSLHHWQCYMP